MMKTKWISEQYKIGLVDWNEAWLLTSPFPFKLVTEVYRGALVFRIPGTAKRIGYKTLRKSLKKKQIIIQEKPLPF